ncbi:MAG TPA: NADPH:quinone reductase [Mycobacteriales bacterium]|nr:NADPH:quinone reductase [Mycobacteriales bacterium]
MRAALYKEYGAASDVVRIEEVDRPEPGPGEVRVRIAVSAVNPTDWKSRSGATPRPIDGFQIPNQDGAGVIDAVGEGVDAGRIGERVWVWMASAGRRWGTAAEYTVVPGEQAVRLPDAASFDLGASMGVPAMTAHRCLFADGPIDGRTVLIAGGAGAVGHYAIELAKRAGARVATTVSTPEKAELARHAGADLVVNYKDGNALEQLRDFAARFDRIVEVAIGPNLELDLALSDARTTVVSYAADGADPVLPVRACMTANVTLRFVLLYGVPRPALLDAVRDISSALAAGALSELPAHRFSLDETAAAHDAVEARAVGKVLIDVDRR